MRKRLAIILFIMAGVSGLLSMIPAYHWIMYGISGFVSALMFFVAGMFAGSHDPV